MRGSRQTGFSLVEVLLSILLLGLLCAGVAGLMGNIVGYSAISRDTLRAHILAVDKMEECLHTGYEDLSPGETVESDVGSYDGFSRRTTISQEEAGLRRIKVEVWRGDNDDTLECLIADR